MEYSSIVLPAASILQFIPSSAATNAATFGSNPPVFPIGAVGCVTGWLTGELLPLPPNCLILMVAGVLPYALPLVGWVVWNPNTPDPNSVAAVNSCRKLYLPNPIP